MTKNLLLLTLSLFFISCTFGKTAELNGTNSSPKSKYEKFDAETWVEKSKTSKLKGWDYVAEKLIANGIEKKKTEQILSDVNLKTWTPITFKVKPKEPSSIYASLNTLKTRENALSFYREYKKYFKSAESAFNVPAEYILAILQIETSCGQNTGDERIFYWLARLISTGFPPNLKYNLENSEEDPKPTLKELEERAAWLEEEFTPHLLALIELSKELGISPLEVRGSKGGALGLPQFLPKNIAKYGVDGDKNGSVNIFTAPDAIHSVAKFLSFHGWKDSSNKKNVLDTILNYNRSTAYANTVFEMAGNLKTKID